MNGMCLSTFNSAMATEHLHLLLLAFPLFFQAYGHERENSSQFPIVISTWPFVEAVRAAWLAVDGGSSAVDAVVDGCSACEELRCDGTVGPGGSPDENGESTIDALIMDGVTMEVGAVAAMRYVKDGIRAARLVMEHTRHTLLVGEQASAFAISMGLPGPMNLSSPESMEKWTNWKANHCQPNFWKNVIPTDGCGPYHPQGTGNTCSKHNWVGEIELKSSHVGRHSHDTISMAVIDKMGHIAVGTSTNGASLKIPGRVGDGPIAGSSSYADNEVGACGATGDGDIMMRFLPCYQVVESMRLGMEPRLAAKDAISRIARKYPDFVGAVFAINREGEHSGACHGWTFQYSAFQKRMPPEAIDFTSRLLQYSPSLRCTALEVCTHPFFDELHEPNFHLPIGHPLPPLFNFKQELAGASPELVNRSIPEHARWQAGLNFHHPMIT